MGSKRFRRKRCESKKSPSKDRCKRRVARASPQVNRRHEVGCAKRLGVRRLHAALAPDQPGRRRLHAALASDQPGRRRQAAALQGASRRTLPLPAAVSGFLCRPRRSSCSPWPIGHFVQFGCGPRPRQVVYFSLKHKDAERRRRRRNRIIIGGPLPLVACLLGSFAKRNDAGQRTKAKR